LYVPREWVTPASLGMEALTSIYVSMGVTSAQYLPVASALARTSTAAPEPAPAPTQSAPSGP
jgi:uncharacterized membrane protein